MPHQDLVQLLVDDTVPDFGTDGSVYKSYYDACPDDVDALVLLVDGMGAIEGMASSQLRAKAVIGLTGNDGFNNQIPSDVAAAAGVLQPLPVDNPVVTNIPGGPFANFLEVIGLFEMYTAIAYGAPSVLNSVCLGYGSNIVQVMSALNASRSLDPADVRNGTLSLSGYTGVGRADRVQCQHRCQRGADRPDLSNAAVRHSPVHQSTVGLRVPVPLAMASRVGWRHCAAAAGVELGYTEPRHWRARCVGSSNHHRAGHLCQTSWWLVSGLGWRW